MPVRSLEPYLFERGLVGSYPIEALKNATLGIDVTHYVSRLLTSKREQYLDAIGGFPTSLKMYLESDLRVFKEYKITPVFVFNGSLTTNQLETAGYYNATADFVASATSTSLALPGGSDNSTVPGTIGSPVNPATQSSKSTKEVILEQRYKAWSQWNALMTKNKNTYIDQPIQPHEPFRHNTNVETARFQADLIAYFIDNNVTYQVAPYVSWIQLGYLLNSGCIDAIYGPTDCLMLNNVSKFIIGMEFPNKEFRFIDKARTLKELNCSHNEFIDLAMAVGNDVQPNTLPPLQIYPASQLFEIALEMLLTSGTNFYAYQYSNPLKNNTTVNYVEQYQRGMASLRYMPVLKETGRVELYTEQEEETIIQDGTKEKRLNATENNNASKAARSDITVPNDVHDIIGQRLPHEYYFYKAVGLVSGKLFDAITIGIYPVEPPLDGGASESYRSLVQKSVDYFKNQEINLLTQPINRYYQIKKIKQVNWFAPKDPHLLTNRTTPSTFDKINKIVLKLNHDEEFSISNFTKVLTDSKDTMHDFISSEALFPNSVPVEKKLFKPFDLLATNFLRFLYLLEFFELTGNTLKPTKWGQVLLKLNRLGIDSRYQESLVILLVFLKMDVLKPLQEFQPPTPSALSPATLRSYPQESLHILLITRMLTLFQVDQRPSKYHGPIDKKTLIYREHVDFVRENMCEMLEAVIVSSLTSGEFNRLALGSNEEWHQKIVRKIPFKQSTPNTIMAMMWEFFLQKYLHNGNAKTDALALVDTEFNTYKAGINLEEQLKLSEQFLKQCVLLMNELVEVGLVKKEEAAALEDAVSFASKAMQS